MKAIISFFTLATIMMACTNIDDIPTVSITQGGYIGLLSVDQTDGTFYVQDSVEVRFAHPADSFATITMLRVKFAPRMPMMLDMLIDSVTAVAVPLTHSVALLGNNIVPDAMGGAFPQYIITELLGTVTTDSIKFEMKCGDYPLTYTGKAKLGNSE
ncbi:MAG: hypothetical protein LBU62_09390 [Bacteroidales bacterium]|jgi:hypothetical protein|nr:hypothetical protein [Bacteroidales bacterium]